MHEIVYENLVTAPEENIRSLLAYCRIEWSDQCLAFHTNKRTVKTASVAQVREPIYVESAQAWRQNENHLGPLMGTLGVAASDLERS